MQEPMPTDQGNCGGLHGGGPPAPPVNGARPAHKLRVALALSRTVIIASLASVVLFAALMLPHLISSQPANFHHKLAAAINTTLDTNGRLLGAIPREHAKTTLGTVATVLREACLGSRRNILIIAANQREAEGKLRQVIGELESNELLQAAFGQRITAARDLKGHLIAYSDSEIVLAGGVRIAALGFGGKVRGQLENGRRVDLAILDDPEDDAMVRSPQRRRDLREWCDRALLPALDIENGALIWLGTLLHHDSVLAQWMAEQSGRPGWQILKWPAIDDAGTLLWPARWTAERLKQRRLEIGDRAFSQEYLNKPVSLNAQIFKAENWRSYDPAELNLCQDSWELSGQPLTLAAGVDPAIGETSSHDWFAAVVVGIAERMGSQHSESHPQIAVLDVVRVRAGFAKQLSILEELHRKWQPRRIAIEGVAYQAALSQQAFERGLPVEKVAARGSKFSRIEAAAIHQQQGRVHLPRYASWLETFKSEASEFPAGAHDDQLDAFAYALECGLSNYKQSIGVPELINEELNDSRASAYERF